MLQPGWRRSYRLLALASLVLAMAVSAVPAAATSPALATPTLTKKGDNGPDGLPIPPGGVRVGNQVFYDHGRAVLRFDLAKVAKLQGKAAPDTAAIDFICSEGWYCFFEHINYGGRRLSFGGLLLFPVLE
jgi:hypothetical protein